MGSGRPHFRPRSRANDCFFGHLLQDRPCTRCIKRNIGHLCHDESRETPTKKSRTEPEHAVLDDKIPKNELGKGQDMPAFPLRDESTRPFMQDTSPGLRPSAQEEATSASNGSTLQVQGSNTATRPREFP